MRPVEEQILGQEHYEKEHTKPLLNKHNLMTVHNLYVYHCSMDTFKTLKYRIPISLYSLYLLSNRKEAFLHNLYTMLQKSGIPLERQLLKATSP